MFVGNVINNPKTYFMKTGIIIPCYNEENRLNENAFIEFVNNNKDYHLCFVNDGSRDGTLKMLIRMKSKATNDISVVDVKKNVGKASAVRAGVRYLYNREDISHIGFIDADLSTDFNDFKDLVKTLKSDNKLSLVFGSRNCGGKGIVRNNFRGFISNLVKAMILFVVGLPIRDTQCGAKVFTRTIVPVIYGESFVSRWLFDVEIFLRLKRYLGKENVMRHILEQPLMRWEHVDDSKLGWVDALKIPGRLVQIWSQYVVKLSFNLVSPSKHVYPTVEVLQTPQMSIAA